MKIHILAIGKLKTGPLYTLYTLYKERLNWQIQLEEVTGITYGTAATKRQAETEMLCRKIPSQSCPVFLDSKGQAFSSTDFAEMLDQQATQNKRPCFIIGGAEGLERSLWKHPHTSLSFGPATWPHLLVRVMLMEQLYRAQEILAGRKYHH